ncbi:TetR/AcrR family transcriptional regulator [Arthrobacter sp. efr-133-TYG-118]|uniref:TetR/AcrR family transcriptional regulator n=1 Tax=Arthrobacter sp. efr-133-TYG-118 TaxID=3040279 RepID=UPI00254A9E54|nr:TetR/AcrR family transcriptional regulator [Arthrobacter sp. efr-133-TYG-118]
MPRPNTQALRRERLIHAARLVAVRDGAAGTTLRAIAAEAKMEPNAALYYFDSLSALVREVVGVVTEEFIAQLGAAVDEHAPSAPAMLSAAIQAGITGGLDNDLSTILYEFWSTSLRDPEMSVIERSLTDKQISIYQGILDAGVGAGDFDVKMPTADVARLLLGLEDGLVMGILAGSIDRARILAAVRGAAESLVSCTLPVLEGRTTGVRAGLDASA